MAYGQIAFPYTNCINRCGWSADIKRLAVGADKVGYTVAGDQESLPAFRIDGRKRRFAIVRKAQKRRVYGYGSRISGATTCYLYVVARCGDER